MFTPNHVTKGGTHIKDGIDLKRTMFMVILALIPCLLFGMWNVGHQHFIALGQHLALTDGFFDKFLFGAIKVLPLVVVSYGVGLGVEFVFCIIKKHAIQEGFLVSGMLIPLCVPVDVPLWMVAVATVFAVLIGKEVFGGTGMNILNVALTTRAFLFFAYPTKMSGNKVWINTENAEGLATVDGFTGETALGNLINANALNDKLADAGDKAAEITEQLQATLADIPSVMDSFFGWIPGSIGETSALACLLGAGLLVATGIGSLRIMLSMLIGGLTMGLIFNVAGSNPFMDVPAYHQLVIGGFMFGMVFMATDPVTASQTPTGKIIYGFFCGFFGIMIRVFNPLILKESCLQFCL